jgi:hypothetical protein
MHESVAGTLRTRQIEDWGDEDAVTTARITVLSKVLGVDPPTKN